jgi:hypothetical protein
MADMEDEAGKKGGAERLPSDAQGERGDIPEAAKRALAEAAERRRLAESAAAGQPKEIGGRKDGPDPARYGDWEKKGIAIDF